ncbi:equilibrative nucleoside transporter 2-like isoform X1 [Megalops cyprinoides]|uniref:equilibrative nucleoside transporter 2-like isoform X1 n=1 Tax=Megalops cyprinoides TaxID=118141 RepID=UPI0018653651|nr:equilibrative nucleoside transporter 2-like isoform X1 [Megalops cyprinoides]XP_036381390.1 equilibrative nucleoside transporter 2-like isoform X2 [Megalops cyprinoides]XP_036381392.1 equilibrative nucleoside transporter 2-like isoform X1 [Megalops cyprinoides]XP_036381393.1 equilibrative nucleoside transporter 2-like isoform X1 [Megalops cyprinoides]
MKARKDAPVDRFWVVGVIFFLLGLGTLLPWNFFMTATMYFQERLKKPEGVNGTDAVHKEYHFNNWMTLLSQLPLLLFTFLNSFLYQRISEKWRITGSLVLILILFLLTAILVKVDIERDAFFSITMATIWFINSFGAVLQGSLFGLVGLLPQKYSAVFMSGQGLAGAFAAIAMLMSIFSETDKETAALGYFITPCVGTLVTLVSYMLLPHLKFARFYFNKSKSYEVETNQELLTKGDEEIAVMGNGKLNGHANGAVPSGNGAVPSGNGAVPSGNGAVPSGNGTLVHADTETDGDGSRQAFLSLEASDAQDRKLSVLQVFRKIWVMAFCVTFVFTVTLSVFPAITADVKTNCAGNQTEAAQDVECGGVWSEYFIPVCCFLVFNIMDWIGRTVTSAVQWPRKESALFPALVVARVIFVPLFMLCNVQKRSYLPVLFADEASFSVIMMVFALSSGYCACLSMTYAPQLVAPKDAETAGALMTFFLALGLSLGAALSFPLRALV